MISYDIVYNLFKGGLGPFVLLEVFIASILSLSPNAMIEVTVNYKTLENST